MTDRAAVALIGLLSSALWSCGARTGLLLDASVDRTDAAVDAPRPDVCVPRVTVATPSSVEVLLLADRSTSMERDLLGSSGTPRRWDVLRDALSTTLPRYQDRIAMGLQFFPGVGVTGICAVAGTPDLNPAPGQAMAVLLAFGRTEPNGRTPTWLGVQSAGRYLLGRAAPGRFRAILLATDGAPNCNGALDGARCTCTALGGTGQQQCEDDPSLCLDDDRTVSEVSRLAAQGVPTYVVGIDGDNQPELITVLSQLAVAGGRPNPASSARPYYSVRRREDLTSAFDQIQRQVSRCVFSVSPAVAPGATVSVTLDGRPIERDPMRQGGWDWSDAERTTLSLAGEACDRASAAAVTVRIAVACGG
ncbi:MAG: vWA domain-containing protein [Deltaproteobacteria bacterium]|nr:vWA domain-containing protein [Myxococcales bacterium]MDP3216940.1 vWA domain-containing protein [Deltaproteobacteria bacterium]